MDVRVRVADQPGDLGWIVMANAEVYAQQIGWSTDYETLVARIVADFAEGSASKRQRAWIAELDGRRIGCVMCVDAGEDVARLRLLLVTPDGRGHGAGSALVDACLDFARHSGYRTIGLWTNSVLESARHIYQRAGFELIAENPHHSFGADLVGQDWELAL